MNSRLCPSYAAVPGALLLGRVGADGGVERLVNPLPITESFLSILREQDVDADLSYRFAGPCHQGRCSQWADGQCQVARRNTAEVTHDYEGDLPECGIRESCRWFNQQGPVACSACAFVIRGGPQKAAPLL